MYSEEHEFLTSSSTSLEVNFCWQIIDFILIFSGILIAIWVATYKPSIQPPVTISAPILDLPSSFRDCSIFQNKSVIIKVNSETDFAAKSDTFLYFLDELGKIALSSDNPNLNKDEFLKSKFDNLVVADFINNMIAKIGENLILSDLIILKNDKSYNSFYIHNSYSKNIGKIISLINYDSNENDEKIRSLSKNLCMHVAAMKPESIDISDLDSVIIEKEKNIQRELILSSGKPSNIVDKILEGKMSKFFSEVTLLNQKFILDQDKTVKEVVNEYQKDYNYNILSFKIVNL